MLGWIIISLLVFVCLTAYLLMGITERSGGSNRGAAKTASLILGEADAYRGSRSSNDPPLDGHNRIAPPTGGIL